VSQRPSVACTFPFRNQCSFSITTVNFLIRWAKVSFSKTLLHWKIIYCPFFNCKHRAYSTKMITTLQSTDVPHVTWKVVDNSGTNLQAWNKVQKKWGQYRRTCHGQGLNVPPVDVESHSTLSSISHVALENLTQFLNSLLNFNAASENHQQLSPPW